MQTIPKEHDSAVGYLHHAEVGSASERSTFNDSNKAHNVKIHNVGSI
jgi:hypothetical protein